MNTLCIASATKKHDIIQYQLGTAIFDVLFSCIKYQNQLTLVNSNLVEQCKETIENEIAELQHKLEQLKKLQMAAKQAIHLQQQIESQIQWFKTGLNDLTTLVAAIGDSDDSYLYYST